METNEQTIITTRECEATEIPAGTKVKLASGTSVSIKQSLGGSFTVVTDVGRMLRIEAEDADVLGKETQVQATVAPSLDASLKEQVWDQLKTCYDPEIAVNIVELGLIYACEITPLPEGGGNNVEIKMTLTASGCGMGQSIATDASQKIQNLAEVKKCNVEVVWDPPWNPSLMSEAAKKKLGLLDEN